MATAEMENAVSRVMAVNSQLRAQGKSWDEITEFWAVCIGKARNMEQAEKGQDLKPKFNPTAGTVGEMAQSTGEVYIKEKPSVDEKNTGEIF